MHWTRILVLSTLNATGRFAFWYWKIWAYLPESLGKNKASTHGFIDRPIRLHLNSIKKRIISFTLLVLSASTLTLTHVLMHICYVWRNPGFAKLSKMNKKWTNAHSFVLQKHRILVFIFIFRFFRGIVSNLKYIFGRNS